MTPESRDALQRYLAHCEFHMEELRMDVARCTEQLENCRKTLDAAVKGQADYSATVEAIKKDLA